MKERSMRVNLVYCTGQHYSLGMPENKARELFDGWWAYSTRDTTKPHEEQPPNMYGVRGAFAFNLHQIVGIDIMPWKQSVQEKTVELLKRAIPPKEPWEDGGEE